MDIADFGQNGNIVVSCSRDAMNNEVASMKQKSIDIINSMDFHNSVIAGCDKMLTLLNPEFAEKATSGAGNILSERANGGNEQEYV